MHIVSKNLPISRYLNTYGPHAVTITSHKSVILKYYYIMCHCINLLILLQHFCCTAQIGKCGRILDLCYYRFWLNFALGQNHELITFLQSISFQNGEFENPSFKFWDPVVQSRIYVKFAWYFTLYFSNKLDSGSFNEYSLWSHWLRVDGNHFDLLSQTCLITCILYTCIWLHVFGFSFWRLKNTCIQQTRISSITFCKKKAVILLFFHILFLFSANWSVA